MQQVGLAFHLVKLFDAYYLYFAIWRKGDNQTKIKKAIVNKNEPNGWAICIYF